MHFKENEEKITLGMIVGGIVIIGILLTSLIVYLLNINSSNVNEEYNVGKESIIPNEKAEDQFEDVTSEIGKSVNEAMENLTENKTSETSTNNTNVQKENTSKENNTSKEESSEKTKKTEKQDKVETAAKTVKEENKKEEKKEEENKKEKNTTQFIKPVNGEIIREFAPDSLVYSETLKEWITHNGVDIKADKGLDVVASLNGKVTSKKNDPRYGLTVIIDHEDGMRTVYANLLSAENVVEGEEVTAGQTIGTVGNSANFEIADDYHLHFEVLKDGEYVDPLQFMK